MKNRTDVLWRAVMHIESVKRWQWMVIGLVAGLGVGVARSLSTSDLSAYGEGINDQRTFERRVLTNVNGSPLFKDIRVTRQTLDDGAGRSEAVYVVSGKSVPENARAGERYQPMWYAAHVPYKPAFDLSEADKAKNSSAAARWKAAGEPTIIDWLELAHETAGVTYTNAWWDTYPVRTFAIAGFIVIGVVWPFFVNLYYFKSLWRPREEKGVSLRGMRSARAEVAKPAVEVGSGHLEELEKELEAGMLGERTEEVAADAPAAVKTLSTDGPAAAIELPRDDRHFVAESDDFYPTDERMHPKK